MNKRVILIVLDSVGIGCLPDASDFGDAGAHTLGNINAVRPIYIPNLIGLGLGNIENSRLPYNPNHHGAYARLMEVTHAKDTTSGHWEMMGLKTSRPFITFTEQGFPPELIRELERRTGHKAIGNKSASGTAIIDEYGEEQIATGDMIVYTSADSVMQICGNE